MKTHMRIQLELSNVISKRNSVKSYTVHVRNYCCMYTCTCSVCIDVAFGVYI